MNRDFYEVLGVSPAADFGTITRAYRRLALKYHPDRNPADPAAEARFKEITEAYDVLRDPEKRRGYDQARAYQENCHTDSSGATEATGTPHSRREQSKGDRASANSGSAGAERKSSSPRSQREQRTQSRGFEPGSRAYRPQVSSGEARRCIKEWLSEGAWAPRDLASGSTIDKLVAQYVPAWEFQLVARTQWTGSNTHFRTVTKTRSRYDSQLGRTVEESYVDSEKYYVPAHGSHEGNHMVVVAASDVLSKDESDWLLGTPLSGAKAETPDGWRVAPTTVNDAEALGVARQEACRREVVACRQMVSLLENCEHRISGSGSGCLVYFPVWIGSMTYRDKTIRVLVNGINGEVHGQRPLSKTKMLWAVTAAAVIILLGVLAGTIAENYTARSSARLQHVEMPARYVIDVRPDRAVLRVDGDGVRIVEEGNQHFLFAAAPVVPRRVKVVAQLPDQPDQTKDVEIRPGATGTLSFNFFAEARLTVAPADAKVTADASDAELTFEGNHWRLRWLPGRASVSLVVHVARDGFKLVRREFAPFAELNADELVSLERRAYFGDRTATEWVTALRDPDEATRAMDALVKIGDDAIPALTAGLNLDPNSVGPRAAQALGRIRPAGVRALGGVLADPMLDRSARLYAAENLLGVGPDAAAVLPALLGAVKDRDMHIRLAVARTLFLVKPDSPEWLDALISLLDPAIEDGIRANAIEAIRTIGPQASRALPNLFQLLRGRNKASEVAISNTLHRIDPGWWDKLPPPNDEEVVNVGMALFVLLLKSQVEECRRLSACCDMLWQTQRDLMIRGNTKRAREIQEAGAREFFDRLKQLFVAASKVNQAVRSQAAIAASVGSDAFDGHLQTAKTVAEISRKQFLKTEPVLGEYEYAVSSESVERMKELLIQMRTAQAEYRSSMKHLQNVIPLDGWTVFDVRAAREFVRRNRGEMDERMSELCRSMIESMAAGNGGQVSSPAGAAKSGQ